MITSRHLSAMIRQTWPRSALYVLCPPLALNLLHMIHPISGRTVGLAISSVLVVVSLLAKGAIAAFYLRERGSYSDDGAAYITAGGEPPGSVPLTTPIDHWYERRERPPDTLGVPWRCSSCGEELEPQFTECWRCGTARQNTE